MNLLILTQKVDLSDDNLGSFHSWIKALASYFEKVGVICLGKGRFELPDNVSVFSLGKEYGYGRATYLWRFFRYLFLKRHEYDYVFVHMNIEYIILGGLFWRLMGKKTSLWYAHGHVNFSLKMAVWLSDIVFTSSKEGCRINSDKIRVIGQGIDVEKFKPAKTESSFNFKILTHGRITPAKDYEVLIGAIEEIAKNGKLNRVNNLEVQIAGGIGKPLDQSYFEKIRSAVREKKLQNIINFTGPIPHMDILKFLQSGDLYINMSHTGSLDRSILEAMACGLPVISCNEALFGILGQTYAELLFKKSDVKDLAAKIELVYNLGEKERQAIGQNLRQIVVKNHNIENLILKIINSFTLIK